MAGWEEGRRATAAAATAAAACKQTEPRVRKCGAVCCSTDVVRHVCKKKEVKITSQAEDVRNNYMYRIIRIKIYIWRIERRRR